MPDHESSLGIAPARRFLTADGSFMTGTLPQAGGGFRPVDCPGRRQHHHLAGKHR